MNYKIINNDKKNYNRTSSFILAKNYAILFIIISLVLVIGISGVISYKLVKNRELDSTNLVNNLVKNNINSPKKWNEWIHNSTINSDTVHVKVTIFDSKNGKKSFYSKNFFTHKTNNIPIFKAVKIQHKDVLYYRSARKGRVLYQTWISLKPILLVIKSILITILILTLIMLVIGTTLIYIWAKKISRPLENLNDITKDIDWNNVENPKLPIPQEPQEVIDLAISFNEVISKFDEKIRTEKQFVSNSSHELKTPLAAIRGHVELIERHGKEHPEVVQSSLSFINKETRQMQKIVEELLHLNMSYKKVEKREKLDLSKTIFKIVNDYKTTIKQNIELEVTPKLFVYVNLIDLKNILLALLENAKKFTPNNGTIKISAYLNDDKHVAISISDNGVGIDNKDKEHIFERFYRGDKSHNQSTPGSGLGLSIVKKLSERNDIFIEIKDVNPHGLEIDLIFM